MQINKTVVQSILLLLSMIFSLVFVAQKSFFPHTPASDKHQADAYMQQVTTLWMDEQGNVAAEFQAPQMIHYPDDNTTHITDPFVIIHTTGAPSWDITARFAKYYENIEKVVLWDKVRCHQPGDLAYVESTLLTSAITLFPKIRQAETDQPVTAFQLGSHMEAIGLHADLSKGTLNLLSHVRGTYAPPPSHPRQGHVVAPTTHYTQSREKKH